MNSQTAIEKKYADWKSAFYSVPNKQSVQAQILEGLISGLRARGV